MRCDLMTLPTYLPFFCIMYVLSMFYDVFIAPGAANKVQLSVGQGMMKAV